MKAAQFQQVQINLTQACTFRATEADMVAVVNALSAQGYNVRHGQFEVKNGTVNLPVGDNLILCSYEANLFGNGIGGLDFIGAISQGGKQIKIGEIISRFTDKKIKTTEQYVGDHGIAVEIAIYELGECIFRSNSDEVFDKLVSE